MKIEVNWLIKEKNENQNYFSAMKGKWFFFLLTTNDFGDLVMVFKKNVCFFLSPSLLKILVYKKLVVK